MGHGPARGRRPFRTSRRRLLGASGFAHARRSPVRLRDAALTVIRDREDDHGLGPALIIREVHAPPVTIYGKVNRAEAQALVADLRQRMEDNRYTDMTFGVLSLPTSGAKRFARPSKWADGVAFCHGHGAMSATVWSVVTGELMQVVRK